MRRIAKLLSASCVVVLLCFGFGCSSSSDDSEKNAKPSSQKGAGRNADKDPGAEASGSASPAQPPLPAQTAGKACEANEDCATGMCLASLPGSFGSAAMDAPGGYCSAPCMADGDCGEGGVCSGALPSFAGSAAAPGRCLKGCGSGDDCRDGYRCVNGLGMMVMAGAMPDPISGCWVRAHVRPCLRPSNSRTASPASLARRTGASPNGWRLNDPHSIELIGDACASFLLGSGSVLSARFPCEVFTPD